MSEMTKPQRARWNSRMSKADVELEMLIGRLRSTFEPNPVRKATSTESKQESCEAIAAICVQEAIGCLEGAKSRLAAAWDHINWERDKERRNAVAKFTRERKPTSPGPAGTAGET